MARSKKENFTSESYKNFAANSLTSLRGVGERRFTLLEKLNLRTISDLLLFYPFRYEDRRSVKKIYELEANQPAVIYANVKKVESRFSRNGMNVATAQLSDETGVIRAVWFCRRAFEKTLPEGSKCAFFGTPSLNGVCIELIEPEFEILKENVLPSFTGIIPVYSSTEGVRQKWLRSLVRNTVEKYAPQLCENMPDWVINENNFMSKTQAVREIHLPSSFKALEEARRRLAYEELFLMFCDLVKRRIGYEKVSSYPVNGDEALKKILPLLPFDLTSSQAQAAKEIFDACKEYSKPQVRLLQGDVGSGKTLIAILFAAGVCRAGGQSVLIAPTEILAEQLYTQSLKYLEPIGIKCALLKSSLSASVKREVIQGIANGTIGAVAGTQALFSESVRFMNLAAVIIDEQQRFGVKQRELLLNCIPRPHLIMMSATPIPRTLAMALYGDIDVTIIADRPKERIPVTTRVITAKDVPALMKFIVQEILSGGRIYWICPRVSSDERIMLPTAEKRFEWLKKKLPGINISMVHGQMESMQKEAAIEKFRSGESKILVGTTVLEVGIDVPEASVIVIESPERYGLSQLHQLRGRVGRGAKRGVCILIASNLQKSERLKIFAETNDGFKIAEADLKMRKEGDLCGTLQHGEIHFAVADLVKDAPLFEKAKNDAKKYIETIHEIK